MTQGSANGGYLDAIPAMASAHTSSWNVNSQLIHRISWFPFFMGAWCITLRVMGTYCAYNGRVDALCLTFCRLALRPKSPVWAGEIDVDSWSDGINVANGVGGVGKRGGCWEGSWLSVRMGGGGRGSVWDGRRGTLCACCLCTDVPPLPLLACARLPFTCLPLTPPTSCELATFCASLGGVQFVSARLVEKADLRISFRPRCARLSTSVAFTTHVE